MRLSVLLLVAALAGCGAPPRAPQAEQADRLNAAGESALRSGHPRSAVARFTAAADSSRSIDDDRGLARDLHNRAMALLAAGKTEAALADFDEALRLDGGGTGDDSDRALTQLGRAAALVALGRIDEAEQAAGQAELAAGNAGDSWLLARVGATRAGLAMRRGDLDAAEVLLSSALERARGDDGASGAVLTNRGHLLTLRGRMPEAMACYDAALAAFRRAADQVGMAAALEGSAWACERAGDHAEAAGRWRRAASIPAGGEAAQARRRAEAQRLESSPTR